MLLLLVSIPLGNVPNSITLVISRVYKQLIVRRLYKYVDPLKELPNTQFSSRRPWHYWCLLGCLVGCPLVLENMTCKLNWGLFLMSHEKHVSLQLLLFFLLCYFLNILYWFIINFTIFYNDQKILLINFYI